MNNTAMQIAEGAFTIAIVSLILLNSGKFVTFLGGATSFYTHTVRGLQGNPNYHPA